MSTLSHSFGGWFRVKSGNLFSAHLSTFMAKATFLMMLFMSFVSFSCVYVMVSSNVSHFLGSLKSSAEMYAFVLSTLVLSFMIFPSMSLLYNFSSQTEIMLSVKVVASQWYWSYEVSDLMGDSVPMYMMPLSDMSVGGGRLLEVDNRLVLPCSMLTQFNITSSDVIHSFALPTLGAKVDASSGLLTVLPIYTSKVGTHYGQCSEICGMNHAFMPICVEITPFMSFMMHYLAF